MQTGNGPTRRAKREQRAERAREGLDGWLEIERSEVRVSESGRPPLGTDPVEESEPS
jgi:hypothetical protein